MIRRLALITVVLLALATSAFAPAGGGEPFTDLGFGLPGQSGFTPLLEGEGALQPGETVTLTVSKCAKSSLAHLVFGTSAGFAPLFGGTLVPEPGRIVANVMTRKGLIVLSGDWPAGVPSGAQIYMQWWVLDGQAVQGYSASNALVATAP
jgi:hypothetical protein